jgi:hypothetical protein
MGVRSGTPSAPAVRDSAFRRSPAEDSRAISFRHHDLSAALHAPSPELRYLVDPAADKHLGPAVNSNFFIGAFLPKVARTEPRPSLEMLRKSVKAFVEQLRADNAR